MAPGTKRRLLVRSQREWAESGRRLEFRQGPIGELHPAAAQLRRQGIEQAGRRAPGTHARIPENAGNVVEIDTFGNALDQQSAAIEVQAGN